MDHTQELKHLSLCTGYGGIDLGLSRALSGAVLNVAYVEIETFAVENLVAKIENNLLDVAPVFSDLKRFPWELYRGKVDLVSGGFPCQPFSSAGRRAGDDDPRHLFPYILDGLKRMGRPPLVFLENVEGIISAKLKGDGWSDPPGTSVLLHVLRELERVGYEATAGVFSAREIGAPHQRKRVFIMGCRSDLGESGRALVSGLLERGGTVEYTESRYRPRWRVPELERFQVQAREPSTAPKTMGDTESRKDRQRGPRALDRAQPDKQRENGLSATASGRDRGATYPAPRGRDQYSWEPPRVTVGNTTGARSQRYSMCRGNKAPERRNPPTRLGSSASLPSREQPTMDHTDKPRLQGDVSSELPRGSDQRDTLPSPRSGAHGNVQGQTESAMGRDPDGAPDRMDYAELSRSMDNRTDELRLLGNGVVPDTAARAFRVLWRQLMEYTSREHER